MGSFNDFLNEGGRGFVDIDTWNDVIEQALVEAIQENELDKDDQKMLTSLIDDILMEIKSRALDHDDLSIGEFQRVFLNAIGEANVIKGTLLRKVLDDLFKKVRRQISLGL
jgi:hypothetical protein